jgi:hypothetical protein
MRNKPVFGQEEAVYAEIPEEASNVFIRDSDVLVVAGLVRDLDLFKPHCEGEAWLMASPFLCNSLTAIVIPLMHPL